MKKTMIYQIKRSGAILLGWALSLVLLTMIPLAASAQSSCTLSDTPTDVSRWIESRFAKGKVPPFSFVYDGKPSISSTMPITGSFAVTSTTGT